MQGFQADGFFQEYAVVDYRNAIILPDSLDTAAAAPLFCAGVTAFHGVEECGLKPGQWMAIIGAGGLGQLGVQYAKAMGYKVIAIDIHDAQLEEAKGLGADHTFNSITDKSYVDKIVEITNGGVDAAVNFTASKKAYDSMPPLIRHVTGVLMVVGVTKEPLEFSSLDIAMGRYILKGACNGTCYNMAPCIEFSAKNNIKPYVEYYSIEDLPLMVEKMQSGKARGRMAVKFD
jgi:propanol-preferring alcohol dehydrogenase